MDCDHPPRSPRCTRPDGRLTHSFAFAGAGWRRALRSERNLRIHLLAGALAVVLAWCLRLSRVEQCVLVLTIAAVLTAELINTSIEHLVDLVCPEEHDLARGAKDIAAAAVLTTAIAAIAVGVTLFGPHLLALLGR